ncbi:MAG: GNAT family N-acetyltransferase [Chloroflexi bacterium]|nr:GNAT family N-acetyltransferase [Chloroflexota bacterium]
MVARAISQAKPKFSGIRSFDASRDLFGVGRLLEEAFRADRTFPLAGLPMMRDVSVFLWTLGFVPGFPERISGFVMVEEGQVVGNVTLTLDEGRLDRYFVSNVAVKTEYRRQGIARRLMGTTLKALRERGSRWAMLNVRPNNSGAVQLYRDFGFQEVETNSEYVLAAPSASVELKKESWAEIRPLRMADHLAVAELVRAATPANVQQFRTVRTNAFQITWDDRIFEVISDFLIGQRTQRYVVERAGKLLAMLVVWAEHGPFPHRVAALVQPEIRGAIENDLLAFARRELARFPARAVRAATNSAHPEFIAALEQAGFTFASGLTLMALAL